MWWLLDPQYAPAAASVAVLLVLLVKGVLAVLSMPTGCSGNCNQGRRCQCGLNSPKSE